MKHLKENKMGHYLTDFLPEVEDDNSNNNIVYIYKTTKELIDLRIKEALLIGDFYGTND